MLTIICLLTGDVQEARMARAYLLHEYSAKERYEWILIYCGTDEEALAYLDEDSSVLLLDGREAGIAASCNMALCHAHGEAVLFLSAHYVLLPSALSSMQRALDDAEGAALVLPRLNFAQGVDEAQDLPEAQRVDYQGSEELRRFSETLAEERGSSMISASLNFCFLTQRKALMDLGGFSEGWNMTVFLMLDLCLRFWQANGSCIVAHGAFAHQNEVDGLDDDYMQDLEAFKRRYGVVYPYSFLPRSDLLHCMDLKKPALTVLEVGCACGGTLLRIRNANPKAKIYGIEYDEKAAKIARCFAPVEALDVETLEKPAWRETFDYIILGDVIEHLREPWQAMKNLAALLKPGGHVVVSIPNVMHFSVFRMMFSGHWTYEDAGILDRTHLRFFTREEILSLLQDAGLEPQQILETVTPETAEDKALIDQIAALMPPTADADPRDLHAYQWVMTAQKRG